MASAPNKHTLSLFNSTAYCCGHPVVVHPLVRVLLDKMRLMFECGAGTDIEFLLSLLVVAS